MNVFRAITLITGLTVATSAAQAGDLSLQIQGAHCEDQTLVHDPNLPVASVKGASLVFDTFLTSESHKNLVSLAMCEQSRPFRGSIVQIQDPEFVTEESSSRPGSQAGGARRESQSVL